MFNNLLKTALTAVPRQRVEFIAYTGRTADDLGRWVATYAKPVDAFGSFQAMGTKEAKANGFEVAGRYAKFLTDADIRPVQRDSAPDKAIYDGVTFDVIGVDNWFAQDGWKRVYLVEGDAVAVIPPDPACTITLTHDGLDAFGLAPMSVTGQTVSVTGDGVSDYGMSTGLAGKPVDWTGVRIVSKKIITNPATGYAILHLVKPDRSLSARIIWSQGDGEWQVEIRNLASDTRTGFVRVGGDVTDRPSLGVDGATGDVTAYLNGDVVVTKDTTASQGSFSGLGGMFATDNVIVLDVAYELGNGDTYSAEIITQFNKYEDTYPAGTKDWCGEEL